MNPYEKAIAACKLVGARIVEANAVYQRAIEDPTSHSLTEVRDAARLVAAAATVGEIEVAKLERTGLWIVARALLKAAKAQGSKPAPAENATDEPTPDSKGGAT